MPHDCNGNELKVGDQVLIPATVVEVQTNTNFCNVTLATDEPMYPGQDKSTLALNTKQVVKIVLPPSTSND